MSTNSAVVLHRQIEPQPEDADLVLLASILERVLSPKAGRTAAEEMIETFHGLRRRKATGRSRSDQQQVGGKFHDRAATGVRRRRS